MNITVLGSSVLAFNELLNISIICRTKKSEKSKKCGTLTESKEIVYNFCSKILPGVKVAVVWFGKDFIAKP